MKFKKQLALLVLLLVCAGRTKADVLIALGMAVTALGSAAVPEIYCYFRECCNEKWIFFDGGLQADIEGQLFGQHIASSIILNAVTGFMSNSIPKKPLVLSLHGLTGTGKTFASKLIAKSLFRKGMDSGHVHMFSSELHFPHKSQTELYKSQLQHWIRGNVTNCAHSMFIFDEMDKMHPGLIDGIKPFLDYHDKLDGVSYRRAIFIFLSNAGGDILTQTALDFWKAGKKREEIKLKDVETALSLSVFNNKDNGFWHTGLIEKGLVDFFVPFLPLEHSHVVQCVMAEMRAKGRTPDSSIAYEVAGEMSFFPKDERIFSVTGCKAIASRLNFF
ncbi:hypothetical protein NHX12_027793 [Muraenolepis orangiensis]|uniref:Torsin n=1 Tax=Muraenolepis orangiensis TaxID=630683 RepID=A0A9Q0EEA4_9TELE|nr:hypothetical protein NHX12_027793 [Muraenolepis orangiensis]